MEFQSSPGPRAGRYGSAFATGFYDIVFQSSPGPRAGRYKRKSITSPAAGSFQSSPGPRAGRYAEGVSVVGGLKAFQSSPGPRAGRYWHLLVAPVEPVDVSILARPEGRALHGRAASATPANTAFQSSPGPRAGRYVQRGLGGLLDLLDVSILARPEGRALRAVDLDTITLENVSILARPEGRALQAGARAGVRHGGSVSILARPEGRALPDPRVAIPLPTPLFQSSPGPRAGRYSTNPHFGGLVRRLLSTPVRLVMLNGAFPAISAPQSPSSTGRKCADARPEADHRRFAHVPT